MIGHIVRDARLALRGLAKAPGFTAAAVLSLALGIGANAAIFSVVHALLLRPLPYRDADRLVILWNRSPGLNITQDWFSTAQYFDIRGSHAGFDDLAIAIGANTNLAGDGGDPERVGSIRVSSNLLPMLGATPAAGRLFTAEDDQPGRSVTAILTDATWARRYGRDPAVIGRVIRLNDQPAQIIGVLDERFALPRDVLPTLTVADAAEIFLPLPLSAAARSDRGHEDYNIVGRLKRGIAVPAAQAEMDAITARLRRDFPAVYPPNGGLTFGVVPLAEQVVGETRRPLWILFGAVAFVLLIAAANVGNLMLSRACGREREFAVRRAIGATRGRVTGQIVTEGVVLSALGGAAGVVVALAAVRGIQLARPAGVPRLDAVAIDGPTLLFTMAVALATGVAFGLVSALAIGTDMSASLKSGGRTSVTPLGLAFARPNVRSLLVVGELAAAIVLLVGAGLLVRSFIRLQRVDPGFDRTGVLTFEVMMVGRQYPSADSVRGAYRRLWEALDQVPGVAASGGVTSLPMSGFFAWGPITIEGRAPAPGEAFINADQRTVGGRYFEAMGIPLRRGRLFDANDTADQPRVAIVDERMAAEFWPNQDPIGKRLRNGDSASTSPWITIVGVVGRVKQYALDVDSRIAFYTPQSQGVGRLLYVVVKGSGERTASARAITSAVRGVDPNLPLYRVQAMDDVVRQSMAQRRFAMALLTVFAATALVLATLGIYGVMAYVVSRSAPDLGIRMALGATPQVILAWVLGQAAAVTTAGVGLGLAGALLLTRLMRTLIYDIGTTDVVSFASTCGLLIAAAMTASYLPARRATRVDPVASLRAE